MGAEVRGGTSGGGGTGGTPALVLAATNAAGAATTFIRTDDQVAVFDATTPTNSALGDAAAVGAAAVASRRDHRHGREAFATPAIVLGTAAAPGVATTPIRSDSTIAAFDTTVPVTQASGDAAATGAAVVASRRDHRHGMPVLGGDNAPTRFRVISTGSNFHGNLITSPGTGFLTITANILYAVPVHFPIVITIDQFYTFVNTAGAVGTLGRMALYRDNGSIYPGTLAMQTANFAVDTTGDKTIAITATAIPAADLYWLVFISNGAPQLPTGTYLMVRGVTTGAEANNFMSVAQTFPTDGLPATFPAGATDNNLKAVWMGVRRSA